MSLKSVELLFPWRKFAKKKKGEGVMTFREKKVKDRTVVVNKSSWVSKLRDRAEGGAGGGGALAPPPHFFARIKIN